MAKHTLSGEDANLHGRSNAQKALAMLKVYGGETATPVGSPITAIGGFVALSQEWQSAEVEWCSILSDYSSYGVVWLNPDECAKGAAQFERVPASVRNATSMTFAKALLKYDLMPVWAAVVNEDWNTYVTPEFVGVFPTPFDLCYDQIIRQLHVWSATHPHSKPIAPTFSILPSGSDTGQRDRQWYLERSVTCERVSPPAFGSPVRVVALQMAGLLAHVLYQELLDRPEDNSVAFWPARSAATEFAAISQGVCYCGLAMKMAVERRITRIVDWLPA